MAKNAPWDHKIQERIGSFPREPSTGITVVLLLSIAIQAWLCLDSFPIMG